MLCRKIIHLTFIVLAFTFVNAPKKLSTRSLQMFSILPNLSINTSGVCWIQNFILEFSLLCSYWKLSFFCTNAVGCLFSLIECSKLIHYS